MASQLFRQILYRVEAYKLYAAVLFGGVMSFALLQTLQLEPSKPVAYAYNASAPVDGEVVSHTVIGPNRVVKQLTPPLAEQARPITPSTAIWPMQGKVTTRFGVPHRPWQKTHTGIDISSGARSGTTAVVAFRDGTVAKTVRSTRGYGNHVVVDHGGGISSLYAHFAKILVTEGQSVVAGQPLGTEGRTGATTGPHVHFEILVDGKPTNPRTHIAGNP
jgi:murein DD-endopeptidase MepM/ murein hydrolase activator NlpD